MDVVHHNVLPSISVHLALVDPDRGLYDRGDDDVRGVEGDDVVDYVYKVNRIHLTFSKIINLSAQR